MYTPSGIVSSRSGICGLHYFSNPPVGQILFPNTGCFPGAPYPHDAITDAAINTSAHEIMETVTDPFGDAWYCVDVSGEISDLCNFGFGARGADGSNVTLGGHPYLVATAIQQRHVQLCFFAHCRAAVGVHGSRDRDRSVPGNVERHGQSERV